MKNESLKLAFVGDVCLSFIGNKISVPELPEDWLDTLADIGSFDLLVGNLECCLIDQSCSDAARSQTMAVPAAASAILSRAGFSHFTLANNHILDCGPDSLLVTQNALAEHSICYFGAGANLKEAEKIVFTDHNGRRIAFVGACDISDYYATATNPGIAPLSASRLKARVTEAASQADLVVVTLHADLEFSEAPGRWRQRLARQLIGCGAHLVIQHHPHVLQGIEAYQDSLIAYSLGNFVFRVSGNGYQEHRKGTFDSLVLVVEVTFPNGRPRLDYKTVALRLGEDHWPHALAPTDSGLAHQELDKLSALLCNSTTHRQSWYKRCREEARARFYDTYYAVRRGEIGHSAEGIYQLVRRHENRRWLLGLLSRGHF